MAAGDSDGVRLVTIVLQAATLATALRVSRATHPIVRLGGAVAIGLAAGAALVLC